LSKPIVPDVNGLTKIRHNFGNAADMCTDILNYSVRLTRSNTQER